MPKGQYERKPRTSKVEAPSEEELVAAAMDNPFYRNAQAADMSEPQPDPEVERIAALLTQPAAPYPLPERTTERFEDWVDEEPAVVPADSRVTQMVGEWAALICPIQHTVTWLTSPNGRELLVELVTEHGPSNLHADAGAWNEADIAKALDAMRVQLGV